MADVIHLPEWWERVSPVGGLCRRAVLEGAECQREQGVFLHWGLLPTYDIWEKTERLVTFVG